MSSLVTDVLCVLQFPDFVSLHSITRIVQPSNPDVFERRGKAVILQQDVASLGVRMFVVIKNLVFQGRDRKSEIENPHDWPAYRHDGARSGTAKTTVPAKLKQAWQVNLGGRLTAPVAAGGNVYVAAQDTHTVHLHVVIHNAIIW
ncbi:MAG: hypothetical protein ACYSWO_23775 [Planctomycetota bacterium]